jgi:UDP-N-acetylglucosamine 4,6-dehydratase
VAEKLFVQANSYSGQAGTHFGCVRYGNVVGSRGSVIPLFEKQRQTGSITLTDERMTRFWITLEQGVEFVIRTIELCRGGEVFVPKIPSMRLVDLADAIAPDCEHKIIGIRPGEKLHEMLVSPDESRHTLEFDDMFIIQPMHSWWEQSAYEGASPMNAGTEFSSNTNDWWLTEEELGKMIGKA